jgi:hypothetical protein
VVVLFVLSASAALAQQPTGAAPAKPDEQKSVLSEVTFLTGYRFHLGAASIQADDPRFGWDCYFGGDIDVVDYRYGRINLLADYEVMLGEEFRSIDPNQGNYYLDLSASARKGSAEFLGVFHHVSRHLGDRANRAGISWNTLGLKAIGTRASGPTTITYNGHLAKVLQAAFVDYAWEMGGGGEVQYRLSRRYGVLARADLTMMGVDRAVGNRDSQMGGKVEGAVRLYGTGAGIEAFAGWERRIDPYPNERETQNWMIFGFRFISR